MTHIQAVVRNCGNHPARCKPSVLKKQIFEALSRDAGRWDGDLRSSVETPVMGVERREVVRFEFILPTSNRMSLYEQ
jgi:hypothetical protein